jgi:ectoine hydroxylase-related dioxygenase (phytanoyl-CoA dioxygenase family)
MNAVRSLLEDGFVVLDDVVPVAVIDALREAMERDLAELQQRANAKPRPFPGHLQHQPPFAVEHLHPEVLACPEVVAACRAVMGHDIRVVLYTANTNMPGSVRQWVHCDLTQLHPDLDPVPAAPHLVLCNVPLVDTSEHNAVELWPGTHRDPRTHGAEGARVGIAADWQAEWRTRRPPVQVAQRKGSVLLRDARLWHCGVPNTAGQPRVMVAVGYAPSWYSAAPLVLPTAARGVVDALEVPVLTEFRDDIADHLDPSWSGLAGPQMRPAGARR